MSHNGGDTDNHKNGIELIPSKSWGSNSCVGVEQVRQNILEIEKKFAHCKPRIVGVTKYFGLEAMLRGYEAGLRAFGESRALDAIDKINALPDEVRRNSEFHFIGHLQTNKAEKVVEFFDCIQSVDSLKLAKVISLAACRLNKRERILLQVNNAEEIQKFGYSKEQLKLDLPEIMNLEGIDLAGLMCMAPLEAADNELRSIFCDLRRFRDELSQEYGIALPELSMGMSNDYHIAIEEGATIIRIGRKLFS